MSPSETSLRIHFAEAFRQITRRAESPDIHVTFYPFAGLNHTIRIRKQRVYVRISDIMRDAPASVHRALAFILVSKLYNKRVTAEHQDLYRQYAYHPQVQRATDLARQQRGRRKKQQERNERWGLIHGRHRKTDPQRRKAKFSTRPSTIVKVFASSVAIC